MRYGKTIAKTVFVICVISLCFQSMDQYVFVSTDLL